MSSKVRRLTLPSVIAFCFGFQVYHETIVNNLESTLRAWINDTYETRHNRTIEGAELDVLWGALTSSFLFGALLGIVVALPLSDRYGRKRTLLACCFITLAGTIYVATAKAAVSVELFCIGRFLLGIGAIGGSKVASMFVSEISSADVRGSTQSVFIVSNCVADLAALVVGLHAALGTAVNWPYIFVIPPIFAVLLVLIMCVIPDSPHYLAHMAVESDELKKSIIFYRGRKALKANEVDLEDEDASDDESAGLTIGIRTLLTEKKYRKSLLLALTSNAAAALCGVDVITFYSTGIVTALGTTDGQAQYVSIGFALISCVASGFAFYFIERFGRRPLVLSLCFGCALILGLIAILSIWESTAICVLSVLAIFALMLVWPLGTSAAECLTPEMFETSARSTAIEFVELVCWFIRAVAVFAFPVLRSSIGLSYTLLPNVVVLLILGVYIWRALPETKERDVHSIVFALRKERQEYKPL